MLYFLEWSQHQNHSRASSTTQFTAANRIKDPTRKMNLTPNRTFRSVLKSNSSIPHSQHVHEMESFAGAAHIAVVFALKTNEQQKKANQTLKCRSLLLPFTVLELSACFGEALPYPARRLLRALVGKMYGFHHFLQPNLKSTRTASSICALLE